jgi:hypothetical protein
MKSRLYFLILCFCYGLISGGFSGLKINKLKVFNSKLDKMGKEITSNFQYKNIYTFPDRLVILSSDLPESRNPDPEKELNMQAMEEKIERVIHFSDIILDCPGYSNKLCHVKHYPGIEKFASFNEVKSQVNSDMLCIVVPFYDNLFQDISKKVIYVCAGSTVHEDIIKFLQFKNELSRDIDYYQVQTTADRYSGTNGQLKAHDKFITVINNLQETVIAKLYNTSISMTKTDGKFLKTYSLYQQRLPENGAYTIAKAKELGLLAEDWTKTFQNGTPAAECCVYFKGETPNSFQTLCLSDGSGFETDINSCPTRLGTFINELNKNIENIKFMDNYYSLRRSFNKPINCNSPEYTAMRSRAEMTLDYSIKVDCRIIMIISNSADDTKNNACFTNYEYEFTEEKNAMAFGNPNISKLIQTCVTKSFTRESFQISLSKEGLVTKPSSFIEKDEYVNEDIIDNSKIKLSPRFKQTNDVYDYNRRLMLDLQNKKVFRPVSAENMTDKLSKASVKGDEFMSFLGIIGEKSLRAGKIIEENEKKKLYNMIHNIK